MAEKNLLDFPEVLRVKGVMARGYGIICKFPMTDPELSLSAKAVYAMICAVAGSDGSAFPSRDKITGFLKIGKDKCTAAMKELTAQGYLSVSRRTLPNGQYTSNEYTIESNPKKFKEEKYESSGGSLTSSFSYTGIMRAGYGMLPRLLIMDDRLSFQAKVIYAYLASFTGAGTVAFPKTSLIQYHLGISQSTYQRHMHQLIETNYISVVQRHINGLLAANNYTLELNPDKAAVKSAQERRKMKTVVKTPPGRTPRDQIRQSGDMVQIYQTKDMDQVRHFKDTAKQLSTAAVGDFSNDQMRQNQDTAVQVLEHQALEDQVPENQLPVIGASTKNSISINSFSTINPSDSGEEYWTDGLTREEIIDILAQENELYETRGAWKIPMTDAQIEYIVGIIADFALSGKDLRIRGVVHKRGEVLDRLTALSTDEYHYVVQKINRVRAPITNMRKYYLTCLYSAREDRNMEIERQVAQDLAE